jgi:hypothetical protein
VGPDGPAPDGPATPDLTGSSPVPGGDPADDRSLLGPRLIVVVVGVLALTAGLCSLVLPRVASPPKTLIRDDFDRTAQGLGTTDTGQPWVTPTPGSWSTADGEAYVHEPNPAAAGRTMALVDMGSDNGSVSATISGSASGWGLVFRYRGPAEFWTVTASTRFAAYNITHVTKGRAEQVDRIPMARLSPGTVVGVQFQGPQVTILVDDRPVKTVTDPDGGNGGHSVGMVLADGSTTGARWRAFEARRLPLSPDPKLTTTSAPAGPGAPTTAAPTTGGR